jgi:hypothetical protein
VSPQQADLRAVPGVPGPKDPGATMQADPALESTPGRGTIATLRLPPGITISEREAPEESS